MPPSCSPTRSQWPRSRPHGLLKLASEKFLAGMVRAALDLYQTDDPLSVDGLARGLGTALPPALRLQVLMDMGRIAGADGEQSPPESAIIACVRTPWES